MCVGPPKTAEHLFLACPDSYRDGSEVYPAEKREFKPKEHYNFLSKDP
jgi:hypothetical protein